MLLSPIQIAEVETNKLVTKIILFPVARTEWFISIVQFLIKIPFNQWFPVYKLSKHEKNHFNMFRIFFASISAPGLTIKFWQLTAVSLTCLLIIVTQWNKTEHEDKIGIFIFTISTNWLQGFYNHNNLNKSSLFVLLEILFGANDI